VSVLWAKRGWMSGGTFVPYQLFASGAQGAWYDPSDFSTLFQDSAGSTPVTAVEQPVRLMRDKSGRTNHATAPNDASRPILRSRYNRLTFSEQFDNADWTKSSATVTANTDTAPDGILTADTLEATGANGTTLGSLVLVAGSYTFSVYLRRKTGTGNVDISAHSGGTFVTQTITSSWARYTVTQTLTAGTRTPGIRIVTSGDEVYAWGAQLLSAADQTSTGGAYQRIAAATDYDVSNPVWRPYLAFDGTDNSMATASVDLSGTDKATIFMGMHKASDAASSVVLGHGADFSAVGAFEWQANTGANATTAFRARSSAGSTANAGFTRNVAAPSTFVFASLVDYAAAAGAEFSGRYNGVVQAQNDGPLQENTGTFGNNVLTIGSRQGGASQRFNGRLYSLLVLGRAATTAELTATESWINGKTGAY